MGNTIYEQVVAAWNTEADAFNQWDALDEQEKIEHAIRFLSENPGVKRVCRWVKPVDKPGMNTECQHYMSLADWKRTFVHCPHCGGEVQAADGWHD